MGRMIFAVLIVVLNFKTWANSPACETYFLEKAQTSFDSTATETPLPPTDRDVHNTVLVLQTMVKSNYSAYQNEQGQKAFIVSVRPEMTIFPSFLEEIQAIQGKANFEAQNKMKRGVGKGVKKESSRSSEEEAFEAYVDSKYRSIFSPFGKSFTRSQDGLIRIGILLGGMLIINPALDYLAQATLGIQIRSSLGMVTPTMFWLSWIFEVYQTRKFRKEFNANNNPSAEVSTGPTVTSPQALPIDKPVNIFIVEEKERKSTAQQLRNAGFRASHYNHDTHQFELTHPESN